MEGSTLKVVDGGGRFGSTTAVPPASRQAGVASAALTASLLSEKVPRRPVLAVSLVATLHSMNHNGTQR